MRPPLPPVPPDATAYAVTPPESPAAPAQPVLESRASLRQPRESVASLQALAAVLPGLRWLIGLLIASIIIAALYFGRDILIPLALRGVAYKPIGASALLLRNILIYGVGGLIAPFIGIKLIDMVVGLFFYLK